MASFLEGKIKVPGVGEVPRLAAAGGLAVVGFLIWRYRTGKSSAAAPAAAAAGTASDPYPPDGTTGDPSDPNSTDPDTGMTYGDEQVSGNLGSADGLVTGGDSYPWDGTYNNSSDPYSMDTSTGTTFGDEGTLGGGGGGGGSTSGPPFSTNAAWAQYAQNYLTQTVGLDAGTVSGALGLYTEGQPVTAAQEGVINQAIAFAGQPPVTGTNGYPPSINVQGTKTGGGQVPPQPTDLAVRLSAATTLAATWKPSSGATGYMFEVTPKDPAAHNIGDRTDYDTGGLKASTTYTVHVAAVNANGTSGYVTKTIKTAAAAKKK